jgi:deazaflavin-dependent oxidoreductase (nitroreductase family)
MTDFDPNNWEEGLIADMRAHGGSPSSGPLKGNPLLIMISTGARTGEPRRAILTYTREDGDYIVAGTKSGAPTDPLWVTNVQVNPVVSVEAAGRTFDARATVIAGGPERDRLWDQHVAELPWFAEYPAKAGRVIPIVRLTPVDAGG